MRKFNVNVNGNSYVVEVEEIGAAETAPAATSVAPAPAAAPAKPLPQAAPRLSAPCPEKFSNRS